MTKKSKKLYSDVLAKLIERASTYNLTLNPKSIKMDFEPTSIGAMKFFFPNAKLTGCNFYLAQILMRRIQTSGFTKQYKTNIIFFNEI